MTVTVRLSIAGMMCAGCVSSVEASLQGVAGVETAKVNLAERTALVTGIAQPEQLVAAVKQVGYDAAIMQGRQADVDKEAAEQAHYKRLWHRVWVAALPGSFLMLGDMLFHSLPPMHGSGRWFWFVMGLITLGVLIYSGGHFFRGAWQQLKHRSSNMDTLIALGTGTAWLYSMLVVLLPQAFPSLAQHAYFEAALVVIALVNLGHALEMRARGRTTAAIKHLMNLQPPMAHVVHNGEESDQPLEEVGLQATLRVRSGETIPLDGSVLEGHSHVDESMLSGEALPVAKTKGSLVTGGTRNGEGSFLMKVSHIGTDTVLAKIIEMIRQAQSSKPAIAGLADQVAAVFVPVVVLIALLSFLLWLSFGPTPSLSYALVTSMTVLVIACPCALGLATPIAIIAGTGKAAQHGILIRHGDALQQASKLDTIVLDKTGTLTEGKPTLHTLYPDPHHDQNTVLQIAASLEKGSEHSLGQALRAAAKAANLKDLKVNDFTSLTGYGVQGSIAEQLYFLGNTRFMQQHNLSLDAWQEALKTLDAAGQTPVFLAQPTAIIALFAIADTLKADALSTVQSLQAQGLALVMLTGDRREVAEHLAAQLGIPTVHAEVLPTDKLAVISQLQQQGKIVGMVGDGINDAPALAQANVGFAIGAGTEVAIAAADVTLIGGSLAGIERAIRISKATTRTIWQNLFFAFAYNVIGIPIAAGILYPAFGILLDPMLAGAAMALSSVTVVLNANRLAQLKV